MSDDGSSLIDDHLLELTGRSRPRVCFVPTASGDDDDYSGRFVAAFTGRAETSVLSLFCHEPWGYSDPRVLLEQDLVYVGGGSTANLLAVWRLHGLPAILREAAAQGTVLAGISAGMNCWFEGSSTDSFGPLAPSPTGSVSSPAARARTTSGSRVVASSTAAGWAPVRWRTAGRRTTTRRS